MSYKPVFIYLIRTYWTIVYVHDTRIRGIIQESGAILESQTKFDSVNQALYATCLYQALCKLWGVLTREEKVSIA